MKIIAGILIVLALVVAIVPQFTDCQSQGRSLVLANSKTVPMKCHWTAQAEIAVAAPLLAVGALVGTSKRKESLRALSILGIVLGLFIILIPTYLIGVCASFEMICNSLMKPVLIFGGVVVTVASIIGLGLASRQEV